MLISSWRKLSSLICTLLIPVMTTKPPNSCLSGPPFPIHPRHLMFFRLNTSSPTHILCSSPLTKFYSSFFNHILSSNLHTNSSKRTYLTPVQTLDATISYTPDACHGLATGFYLRASCKRKKVYIPFVNGRHIFSIGKAFPATNKGGPTVAHTLVSELIP